ncbi:MAG: tetratricopeptide repeat protein [Bacteroidales bacterium]|nr:tetratricopeptide repeat protein [Bacteroidales bacterium]
MVKTLSLADIEKLLIDGRTEESVSALHSLLKCEPQNDRGWYLLGSIYHRGQMWAEAIDAYGKAKMLSPDGPADAAIESIYGTLRAHHIEL